ncbi:MAG: hypothetical protein GY929_16020 [Actinomycetia bacterium]|nr:hypothetical protein [Actinomycetes bacterium]
MENCIACEAILQPEWDVCLICGHDPSTPAPKVAPDPATLVPVPGPLDQIVARPVLMAGVVGVAILVVALVGALLVSGPGDESVAPPQLGFVDRGNQAGAAFCRDGELAIRALPPTDQSDFRPTVVFWENENGGWERLGEDLAPEGLTAEAGALVEQVGCLTLAEGPVDGELCSWAGQGQVLVRDAAWRATLRRAIDGTPLGVPVDIASTTGCSIAELAATNGLLTVRPPRPAMDDLAAFLTPWVGTGEVERLQAERAARQAAWTQVAPACAAEHALIPDLAPWTAGYGTLVAVAEATNAATHSTSSTPSADGAIPDFWRATVDGALEVELILCVTPAAGSEIVVTPAVCPAVPAGEDEVAPMVEVGLLSQPVDVRLFAARSGQVLFEHQYPATAEPGCPDPAVVAAPVEGANGEGPLQIWVPSPLPGPELVESLVGFVEG